MKVIIFFILILVFLLVFGINILLIRMINRVNRKKMPVVAGITKFQKRMAIITSIIVTVFVIYFLLFTSRSYNYREAYIETATSDFIITIFGKSSLMAHDPISFLEKDTYEDSIKFNVSKSKDTINAGEVLAKGTYFKFISGNIIVNEKSMRVNLYYIDAYDKKLKPLRWNGDYKLNWR